MFIQREAKSNSKCMGSHSDGQRLLAESTARSCALLLLHFHTLGIAGAKSSSNLAATRPALDRTMSRVFGRVSVTIGKRLDAFSFETLELNLVEKRAASKRVHLLEWNRGFGARELENALQQETVGHAGTLAVVDASSFVQTADAMPKFSAAAESGSTFHPPSPAIAQRRPGCEGTGQLAFRFQPGSARSLGRHTAKLQSGVKRSQIVFSIVDRCFGSAGAGQSKRDGALRAAALFEFAKRWQTSFRSRRTSSA